MYLVEFDPGTAKRLAALAGIAATFDRYFLAAMSASVAVVTAEARKRAPVGSRDGAGHGGGGGGGRGALQRGIEPGLVTPMLGEVGVNAAIPYALRRERGFSGMWDTHRVGPLAGARWRFYSNDPGAFFMRDGLVASLPYIEGAFMTASQLTLREVALVGGGIP